ncbi:MAG: hypothetical protein ACTH93_03585, partial [Pseudoclavibacter sp.]
IFYVVDTAACRSRSKPTTLPPKVQKVRRSAMSQRQGDTESTGDVMFAVNQSGGDAESTEGATISG